MPHLELAYDDGRRDRHALSRTSPVTIGAQSFNDISIADRSVSAFHCRIGWNKTGYEVTAATSKGVDLNGTIIEHAFLKAGDVLRVGPVDVIYHTEAIDAVAPPAAASPKSKPAPAPPPPPAPAVANKSATPAKPDEEGDSSLFEGPVYAESADELSVSDLVVEDEVSERPLKRLKITEDEPAPVDILSMKRAAGGKARTRPGEQDPLKSPLVLGLTWGSAALLLITGTLWFLMGRESASQQFEAAEKAFTEGRFTESIEGFEKYLAVAATGSRAEAAQRQIAKAKVRKELASAAPAWPLAWDRLQELVTRYRSEETYDALLPDVRLYAEEIALGAAKSTELDKDEKLLPISDEAAALLERSADPEAPVTAILTRIQEARAQAVGALTRQKRRDESVAQMEAALAKQQPIEALAERARLLAMFPEYAKDKGVEAVLNTALSRELATVRVEKVEEPAPAVPVTTQPHHVLPAYQTRSRTDDASVGASVWVLAQDSCYAVDTMTGDLKWKNVIGQGPPAFFPLEVRSERTGWLVYNRRDQTLVLARVDQGTPLWQHPLESEPVGQPLLDEGSLYVVTRSGQVLRYEAETGLLSARLTFSQPLAGPVVLDASRQFLFVAGERGVIYALRKRPLECVALTFTDHAAGAVQAPLVTMGRLLLMADNDRTASARLRTWDTSDPTKPLRPEVEQRVDGQVYDAPALRGSQLVVPLNGERLAAFVVNDEEGRPELKPVGGYRVQDGYQGPMSVVLGPDQQFWLSSTAFRRFEIGTESLRLDPTVVAMGLTSQPPQLIGEMFYVARRHPATEAVHVTNVDRRTLKGTWRTTLGARPVAVSVGPAGNLVLGTESGLVFSLTAARLGSGGIETSAGVDLEWPNDLREPCLSAEWSDGRLALAIGGSAPRLWIVDPQGRVAPPVTLPAPLECPPISMTSGVILPIRSKLSVLPLKGGRTYQDWRAAIEDEPPAAWSFLVSTGDDTFVAMDRDGQCLRMEVREGETPHVAQGASAALAAPSALPPLIDESALVYVDQERTLHRMDHRTLEPRAQLVLEDAPLGWTLLNGQIAVWTSRELVLVEATSLAITHRWELRGRQPTGRAIESSNEIQVGCRGGEILAFPKAGGPESLVTRLPQGVSYGLVNHQGQVWAIAADGAIWRVTPTGAQP